MKEPWLQAEDHASESARSYPQRILFSTSELNGAIAADRSGCQRVRRQYYHRPGAAQHADHYLCGEGSAVLHSAGHAVAWAMQRRWPELPLHLSKRVFGRREHTAVMNMSARAEELARINPKYVLRMVGLLG